MKYLLVMLSPALLFACASHQFDVPYDRVVKELHDLYPPVATDENSSDIPDAYRSPSPVSDTQIDRVENPPGRRFTLRIATHSKGWQRTATIEAWYVTPQQTRVSVHARSRDEWGNGLTALIMETLAMPAAAVSDDAYERDRWREIREALMKP